MVVDDNIASLRKEFIFHPFGRFKIMWDSFIGLLIIYSVTCLPMEISFKSLDRCVPLSLTRICASSVDVPPMLFTPLRQLSS